LKDLLLLQVRSVELFDARPPHQFGGGKALDEIATMGGLELINNVQAGKHTIEALAWIEQSH
jgi:hypothetical protein